MARYCYRNGRDMVERIFPASSIPEEIEVRGRTYKRSRRDEWEEQTIPQTLGWPMECVASGVHPSQRQELADYLKKKGVPTEVNADGNPIYRDAQHRKKALKARGFYDKASYF